MIEVIRKPFALGNEIFLSYVQKDTKNCYFTEDHLYSFFGKYIKNDWEKLSLFLKESLKDTPLMDHPISVLAKYKMRSGKIVTLELYSTDVTALILIYYSQQGNEFATFYLYVLTATFLDITISSKLSLKDESKYVMSEEVEDALIEIREDKKLANK